VTIAGGFDIRSFELLPQVEERSFWFRARNRLIVWALRRYFPYAQSFLEIGCGTGFVLRGLKDAFPALELTGAELFEQGLEVARRRLPEIRFMRLDARQMPFDAEFDVVGSFDVLEHLNEDERALASMFDAVKPGGGILITVPQHPRLWSAADEFGRHVRRYGRRELVEKVKGAGFRIERVTSFVTLLLPLMAVSRVRQRRLQTFDPLSEYRHSRAVDISLERLMNFERGMIRAGLSLPVGGSLLVVGRRD
jgi:SAM-dependent methyltransferase